MAPPLHFELPLEIVGARVRLVSFGVREGTPPGNPLLLKITFFQWFFNYFSTNESPKGPPPDPPSISRCPPRGSSGTPPKLPWPPWVPKRSPGLPNAPSKKRNRVLIQVSYLETMFCHTSPVILIQLYSKWLWPLREAYFRGTKKRPEFGGPLFSSPETMFCHTSPVILIQFCSKWLWPLREAYF